MAYCDHWIPARAGLVAVAVAVLCWWWWWPSRAGLVVAAAVTVGVGGIRGCLEKADGQVGERRSRRRMRRMWMWCGNR